MGEIICKKVYGHGRIDEWLSKFVDNGFKVVDYKFSGDNRFYTLRKDNEVVKLYWLKCFSDFLEYVVVIKGR